MSLLSHFWELEDHPSINYHCFGASDGDWTLGMVIIGGTVRAKCITHPMAHLES